MNERVPTVLRIFFLFEQSLKTGYTDFLSRSLAPIALWVFFDLSGGLDKGEVRKGAG